jgi:isorenieratene synthase
VPIVRPDPAAPPRLTEPVRVVVVGGGLAGAAAATVLAERGANVVLLEALPDLGGRLRAWPVRLADGSIQSVTHGFHAFFRQYYNLRALLRRVDPGLSFLRPVADYPVVSRDWPPESFARLPRRSPYNLVGLVLRSPSLRLRDLRTVDRLVATELLAFDRAHTYAAYDDVSAGEFLDRLAFPDRARAVLFEVFAHSFFNDERRMSAAEMIMMFHYYFLGNPEGLLFDAPDDDYGACIWEPLAMRLQGHGADIRVGTPATHVEPAQPAGRWRVVLAGGGSVVADHVVLATDAATTRTLVERSPALGAVSPRLAVQVATLRTADPYVVGRFWTDRAVAPRRAAFNGVARAGALDCVAVYSRLERDARRWADRTGGTVLELHAYRRQYADPAMVAELMLGELATLWPETRGMHVVDSDVRVGTDASAYDVGSDRTRPGVVTDAPGVTLAGDWVQLPFPSALMERAVTSGVLAANTVLTEHGRRTEALHGIAPRGALAGRGRRSAVPPSPVWRST